MLAKIPATVPREFVQGNICPAASTSYVDPLRTQEAPKVQPVFMVVTVDLRRTQESPTGRAGMRRDTDPERVINRVDREDIFNTPDFCCRRARGQSGQHFFPTRWTVTPAFALMISERASTAQATSIERLHYTLLPARLWT
nr:hypothetical protein [Methanosarcina horonobensis]